MELQAKHRRELSDRESAHQKKVSFLKSIIQKAKQWFPQFQELVYMERFCQKVGFDERQTSTLISGKRCSMRVNSIRRSISENSRPKGLASKW